MMSAPAPPSYTPRHCAARLRLTEGGLRPLRSRFTRYSVLRRGGRAVECGGLENRSGRFRPARVQIPPPPLGSAETGMSKRARGIRGHAPSSGAQRTGPNGPETPRDGARLARARLGTAPAEQEGTDAQGSRLTVATDN